MATRMGGRAQALLEGTDSGVVYASLGTLCTFGLEGFRRVAAALGALPQRVVWKLAPGDLPGNATLGALRLAPNLRVRPAAPPAQVPVWHASGCDWSRLPLPGSYFKEPPAPFTLLSCTSGASHWNVRHTVWPLRLGCQATGMCDAASRMRGRSRIFWSPAGHGGMITSMSVASKRAPCIRCCTAPRLRRPRT